MSLDEQRALDELFSLAYEELRRLAVVVARDDADATLNPTALVHEVWLKLMRSPPRMPISELHFKRIAARAMRQILVDAARRRRAEKRGGNRVLVTFDDSFTDIASSADEVIALDEALDELARVNQRQALMVESRFFGGLGVLDTAELLGVSEATVLRDWRAARAWLAAELRRRN